MVIVSRHDPEAPRALVLYVPLSTQNRGSSYEVAIPKLPFLKEASVANVQGLGALPTVRLERRLGAFNPMYCHGSSSHLPSPLNSAARLLINSLHPQVPSGPNPARH